MNPLQAAALGTIHREKRTIALFCAVLLGCRDNRTNLWIVF